ncbi:MAG: hypothetical protein GXY33_22140 [Phycisphaerae bacterium]|nr:hypothetical protein [Phycisphaerae bacterium]
MARRLALIDIAFLLPALLLIIVLLGPIHDLLSRPTGVAPRTVCAGNLRQIGAALSAYASSNRGSFPIVAFGQATIAAENAFTSDLSPRNHHHSVSENLWPLCRTRLLVPSAFLCPASDQADQEIDHTQWNALRSLLDFPWKSPDAVIAYSFIQPWTRFPDGRTSAELWTDSFDPNTPIAADANDGPKPNYAANGTPPNTDDLKQHVNSRNHGGDGQNVLFADSHVQWSTTPYTGLDNDSIYTAQPENYSGHAGSTPGILSVRPANLKDTVLIPNKESNLANWTRSP